MGLGIFDGVKSAIGGWTKATGAGAREARLLGGRPVKDVDALLGETIGEARVNGQTVKLVGGGSQVATGGGFSGGIQFQRFSTVDSALDHAGDQPVGVFQGVKGYELFSLRGLNDSSVDLTRMTGARMGSGAHNVRAIGQGDTRVVFGSPEKVDVVHEEPLSFPDIA